MYQVDLVTKGCFGCTVQCTPDRNQSRTTSLKFLQHVKNVNNALTNKIDRLKVYEYSLGLYLIKHHIILCSKSDFEAIENSCFSSQKHLVQKIEK